MRFMHDNIIHGTNGWVTDINLNCTLLIDSKTVRRHLMLLDISMKYMDGFRIKRIIKMINSYTKFHHLALPKLDSTV